MEINIVDVVGCLLIILIVLMLILMIIGVLRLMYDLIYEWFNL